MYIGLHVSTGYSCQILMKLEFPRQIFDKYSKPNFIKICPVGAELFHADGRSDGQTDMTKLIVVFGTLRKHLK